MTDQKDKNKYWIEPGKFVERIVGVPIPMTVDEVVKGKNEANSTITVGVKCHWIALDGTYQQAVLRTDELRPHIKIGDNVQTVNPR